MASLRELLAKAKGKLEKIPEIAKETYTDSKEAVADYFEPQPIEDGLRIRDFLREVPGTTGTLAKDILQGTARSFDFVGRQLTPWEEDITPKSNLDVTMSNFLFGGADKRAKTLGDVGETELGIDKEKNPILAPLAGLGIVGLDFVPGGQGKSKGFKQFIKSLTDETAETLAKSTDAELIERTVRESAPALTDKEVAGLVDNLVSTKSAGDVKDVANGFTNTYYHAAPKSAVDDIKKNGFNTKDVYVFGDELAARMYAEAKGGGKPGKTGVKRNLNEDWEVIPVRSRAPLQKGAEHIPLKREDVKVPKAETPRGVKEVARKGAETSVPKRVVESVRDDVINEDFTDIKGVEPKDVKRVEIFGSSVEGKANPNDIDVFVTVKDRGQFKESDGLIEPITFERGKFSYVVMPEGQAEELLQAMLYTGRKDGDRAYSGTSLRLPKRLWKKPEQEATESVETAKQALLDEIPEQSQKKVSKALDAAEKENKKLSPRRLQDAKKYGISEDVFGRMLHSKAGGRLSHEEASDLAETINAPMKDLLTKDPRKFPLSRPKIEAYSQELQGYFEKVVKELKAHSEAHPKDIDLREQYQEASRNYMKARTTLEAVISEAGRVVEGSKVIGKYSRLPGMDGKIKQVRDQIVKYAETHPKSADLPTEFDMALETVDLNNTTQMLDFLTQWNRASFLQKLSEFQKASLLSALSTHAVNALGNAIQQVLDVPVRALAGTLDAGKSAITGAERTVYAGESLAQVRGAFRSFPSAFKRSIKALGNEHYAQELRRTEIEAGTVVPAIRGRFGKVVRLPFRLLQMADLGFRTVKKGAEGDALAYRIAKKEGLKGKAFKQRVDELKQNLPEDMLDLVDERVERSLMLEDLDGMLKWVEDGKNKYPILQFVIPFYRTLVNLSKEAYRMTPIGGVGRTTGKVLGGTGKMVDSVLGGRTNIEQLGRNLERGFNNKWTQNEATRMEELSRQIMGTGIMAWVVTGMLNGDVEITGPAPSNAGDREVFYGQGKLPHSIRMGDTWVEFQRVQPIGQLLQVGASISEAIEAYKNTGQLDSKQVEKEVMNSISDIFSMVFTQSPFTGAADLFALFSGGEFNEGYLKAGNRYLGQLSGTFIPNILRRATVAADPIIYEKRDIKSQWKSRIPGMQDDLTPKRDIFGETLRQGGTFMSRFASPIRTSEEIENQLYKEMDDIGYTPTVPDRKAYNEDLSVKEYETLQLFYGPRFRDELWTTINDPSYKTLNNEQKQDVIANISRKVLDFSRQSLFPVYLEKNQLRKQWEQEGYSPMVIEDALNIQFPYDKATLEIYAQNILDENIQTGEARQTIEELLKSN